MAYCRYQRWPSGLSNPEDTDLVRTDQQKTIATGTYAMDGTEGTIFCNSAGGNVTVTLLAASAASIIGKVFSFVQTSGSNKTIFSGTVGGVVNPEMTMLYETRRLVSNGTLWFFC